MIPVLILAGGKGTRLSEETVVRPKPMVEIGGEPILVHIMRLYAHYGCRDFHIAAGYKADMIMEFFRAHRFPNWSVMVHDTGVETQIAGRICQVMSYTRSPMCVTYGDGVADVNIDKLLAFHYTRARMATVTAVHPPARFGRMLLEGDRVANFSEKPLGGEWINGGFMVLEPEILALGPYRDDEIFERVYLPKLAELGQLSAYVHDGFWQCMDTIREKEMLNELWRNGNAQWRVWSD